MREGPKAKNFDPGNVLDDLAKEADRIIAKAAKDEAPLFLYLPLTGPHKPVWPHERFVGKTELGPYGDFIHQIDDTVGQILASLKNHKIADNTMVLYTSDNGSFMLRAKKGAEDHLTVNSSQSYLPSNHEANFHWRGTKADIYEAGHRVPFLVRWPKKTASGSVSKRTLTPTDVFATFAELLEVEKPDQAEDSYSFLASLEGKEVTPRPPVIHHSVKGTFAIRDGNWKLILSSGSGGRQRPASKPFEKPYQLYDLAADPSETKNQIEENAARAAQLEAEFLKMARDYKTSQ